MHTLDHILRVPSGTKLTNGNITVRNEDLSYIVFTGTDGRPHELFQVSGRDSYRSLCNLVVMLGGQPEVEQWVVVS